MEDRPYSLEVEALDLGPETRAVGLELVETESREPLAGETAARIWAALFPALAAGEYLVLDFFSHLGRVREFCKSKVFPSAKSPRAAWSSPSRYRNSWGNYSSDLKGKPSVCAPARWRGTLTARWKTPFPGEGLTPIRRCTDATRFAPCASFQMAG